ncbi:CotH kinase family protein [Croceitalea sp. MTPC5]|uniref:hypothetical protein n=1 Tax=Croceitalea sp. MTPC5 TaxID=3056565 RepID=UPI002B3E9FC9|nr:CotH kinase family protein [Croceitalea sp. MTPC5]
MKIKEKKYGLSSLIITGIIFLTLSFFSLFFLTRLQKEESKALKKEKYLENPTNFISRKNQIDIIRDDINSIYSDSILSIHLSSINSQPTVIYVYKDSLYGRKRDDKFFLHVFLNDSINLLNAKNFKGGLNLDFLPTQVDSFRIDNRPHYVFRKSLEHNGYKGKTIDIAKIAHINTGRYDQGLGRSLEIKNLKLDNVSPLEISNNLPKVSLIISEKSFRKIREKRARAINTGILLTGEEDLVNCKVSLDDSEKIDAKMRLKGDWTDHLIHQNKWSYRVIFEDEKTLLGIRKISFQHPKVRNYLWEWLFNKVIKDNNIIGLRYDFVNLELNVKHLDSVEKMDIGIMAYEESFDKILIENNRKREGVILAFDESLLWKDRELQSRMGLELSSKSNQLQTIQNAPIKVYNENKVLSDPKLSKQFTIAKGLLNSLRKGEMKISDVFDIDKLTMFVALTNLFGGSHGLIDHNLRVYFNPITNKLEPISFDSYSGLKLNKISDYPFLKDDIIYNEKLVEKLKIVCDPNFIRDFIEKHSNELSELSLNLQGEFGKNLDLTILEYNSNFIKKMLNPSDAIVSDLIEYNDEEMLVEIKNLSLFPVEIIGLQHKDGKSLNEKFEDNIISPNESQTITFRLKESFVNVFVSKKNKIGEFRYPKDLKKIKLKYSILGLDYPRENIINPFGKSKNLTTLLKNYKKLNQPNFQNFEFVEYRKKNKEIIFKSGKYILKETIVIPMHHTLIIEKGFALSLIDNASLISYSPIVAKGTHEHPINFKSTEGSYSGIFVDNAKKLSTLNHCSFFNLSTPKTDIWELSGAVNFHESKVSIENTIFERNRSEDALNIIRSEFYISSTIFKDTQSDAFDGDFVNGEINNSKFLNSGNDGIDVSGSEIKISNIFIKSPSDKGISGGESSFIHGEEIQIVDGEIGIVSKDLSKIELTDVKIENVRLGLSAFQKKSEFGIGVINTKNLTQVNNEVDYLIENKSVLTIDGIPVETVSNNVIDQMYGNEYGKSSK